WLLCRTGAQENRGAGTTLLIVDLHAPGVKVSPLPTLDGEQLNAVALDGVAVPVSQRIGPEGGAWKLMSQALADERHVQFPPRRLRRDLEEVAAWLRARGAGRERAARGRLAALAAEVMGVELLALRVVEAALAGRSGAVEAAAHKVAHTEWAEHIPEGGRGAAGEFVWRRSLWETIGGGTSEVMRGVVARHGLGLG